MTEISEVSLAFSENLTNFLSSLPSLEERDDVPEWLTLFLASFRLLTADFCKANSHLSSKVNILEESLSAVESELAV